MVTLDLLRSSIRERKPLTAAAVGSGMTALAAAEGGADFLLALSAGVYRVQGIGSMAALLPYRNANQMTWEMALHEMRPRVPDLPVFLGVCAQDPQSVPFDEVAHQGFAGVTNFPTVGFIDGSYREALEAGGMGFAREIEMLARAHEAGLLTVGFCFTADHARELARNGIDILCVPLGFADLRERDRSDHDAAMDRSVRQIHEIQAAAGKAYVMAFGGPVLLPQDAALIYQRTGALGYIGGSAIERIPAAAVISQTVRDFKQTTLAGRREDRLGSMIGRSRSMQEVFESIRRVARSDAPVLLVGESGTGKELAAREIHRLGGRSSHPMVSWNCGATTEGLALSELFGHERGAFSGATRAHVGRFERAHGGTLFMDEVADLPLAVQASLLRVLQEGEIVPVGGEKTLHVDVRLIAATNRDFSAWIAGGRFRLDLYYRLSTVLIRIPPLRERREDIPALVRELCQEFTRQYECPVPPISTAAMDRLVGHSWPGNIRQLRNVLERLFILGPSTAWFDEMFEMDRAFEPAAATPQSRAARRKRLREVLARHDGNKTRAARELGVTRKTHYSWLR